MSLVFIGFFIVAIYLVYIEVDSKDNGVIFFGSCEVLIVCLPMIDFSLETKSDEFPKKNVDIVLIVCSIKRPVDQGSDFSCLERK